MRVCGGGGIILIVDRKCPAYEFFKEKIPTFFIDCQKLGAEEFEKEACKILLEHNVKYLFLTASRILRHSLLEVYKDKIFNTHPSLLPNHIGLNAARRAFDSGDEYYGATMHYAIKEVDSGKRIAFVCIKRQDSDFVIFLHRLFVNQCVLLLDTIIRILKDDFKILDDKNTLGFVPNLSVDIKDISFLNDNDINFVV